MNMSRLAIQFGSLSVLRKHSAQWAGNRSEVFETFPVSSKLFHLGGLTCHCTVLVFHFPVSSRATERREKSWDSRKHLLLASPAAVDCKFGAGKSEEVNSSFLSPRLKGLPITCSDKIFPRKASHVPGQAGPAHNERIISSMWSLFAFDLHNLPLVSIEIKSRFAGITANETHRSERRQPWQNWKTFLLSLNNYKVYFLYSRLYGHASILPFPVFFLTTRLFCHRRVVFAAYLST